ALLGASLLPVAAGREGAAVAELRELDGRLVGWFRLDGGKRRGAVGPTEGETIERLVRTACDAGLPVVGVLATSGADLTEGVASLHAWGRVARALAEASGVVPVVLGVVGPCVSGPSLLLGLADAVVMSTDAAERLCTTAADLVPATPTASYDVRAVVADVLDRDSLLELRAGYAPNLVTGLGRLCGQPVGVVANQPQHLAGTLDIAASQK